jgi:hypothetical protein
MGTFGSRITPSMKSRGDVFGFAAAALKTASFKTVFLLGVPRARPPRRSPGFDPRGICYFAIFRIRQLNERLTAQLGQIALASLSD